MKAKPICTSCQHCRIPSSGAGITRCDLLKAISVGEHLAGNTDRVTEWQDCSIQRSQRWPLDILMNQCGQRGRWFQPKQEAV